MAILVPNLSEIGGIAGVVKVAMGKHDELEMAWLTTCADEFSLKFGALVGPAGVDEDNSGVGFYEIAVDLTQ